MHTHHHHESSNRIGWAFVLNFCFTIIEFIGGWLTNSTAIMADAVHDLGDSLSIGMAWIFNRISHKPSNLSFSYGYQRLSLLSALINALVLVLGSIWVMSEALPRLLNPVMPDAQGMIGFALLGVVVNGFAAYKLSKGSTLNERILNWHLIEDVLGWIAVLVVSIVLLFWELPILDPLLSIFFTLFILFNVVKNLKLTLKIFMQAVPDEKLNVDIQKTLLSIPHVTSLHHFHLWSLDGEQHVLTAHLVLESSIDSDIQSIIKHQINDKLKQYDLSHTTVELEQPLENCRDV
jgi:cobalt-zinc-cadmium efflux system protein